MRNRYAWQLASYFRRKGATLDECLRIMAEWHSRIDKGLDPYSVSEMEATIRTTYEKGGYGIGCGSEYVEGLCVGKENCPLFIEREETEFPLEVVAEAEKILAGDPLDYVTEAVQTIHVGDAEAIQIEYISALSPRIVETPINTWTIGSSQKGKSHVKKAVLQVLPREQYEVFTSASPQSLFYYCKKYGESAFDGKLIFIDEVESSKDTLPMLRSLTSPVEIEPRHLSVHEADLLDMRIKGKRVVWFTSVKPFGDEQLRNRFIFLNPDESKEQDEAVFKLQDERNRQGLKPDGTRLQIAQAVTKSVIEAMKGLETVIPYGIEWPYKSKRWLYPYFIAFIQSLAKINHRTRQIQEGRITASQDDFNTTKTLWSHFIEHIIYRVSTPAKTLLGILGATPETAKTAAQIAEETGYTTRHIGNLLQELEEAELISMRKREKEGEGRHAWEYWKTTPPSIEEIKLLPVLPEMKNGYSGSQDQNFQNRKPENAKIISESTPDRPWQPVGKGFERLRVPVGEPCELCGAQPIEWAIRGPGINGILERCGSCTAKFTADLGIGKVSE